MRVGLIGMNYKLFDLELRELFAKKAKKLSTENFGFPIVLLSTCNRTEIYFSAEDLAEAHSLLLTELKKEVGTFITDHHLYSYFGENCFSHIAKVTSGLDSVIFGEAEIQRQVKEAYENASNTQTLSSCLHFMFQKSLKLGKEIRTTYSLPKTHVSMESTLCDLIRYFFKEDKDLSILFVGFSEINRKIIPFLKGKGFSKLHLATRNKEAAKQMPVQLIHWLELSHWPSYDVVICGSVASEYLLRADHLTGSPQNKLVLDLSLPRNVDPQVGRHPSITLFNIEEINSFIEQKQNGICKERALMRKQVDEKVLYQIDLYHEKNNRAIVCA
jgi:glutamyl-tRNA reductase